jgi:signal transduction histidine kinase
MRLLKKRGVLIISSVLLLIPVIIISGCKSQYEDLDLAMYQYRDTKDLVKFVYDASLILKKEGIKSLAYFRNNRILFNTPDYYLYIYDINGINIYHAGMKHLEGKNLRNVTDKDGKKVTQLVLDALDDNNNPHAWVHYSWWQPGKFYPVPKSSCHFKVVE